MEVRARRENALDVMDELADAEVEDDDDDETWDEREGSERESDQEDFAEGDSALEAEGIRFTKEEEEALDANDEACEWVAGFTHINGHPELPYEDHQLPDTCDNLMCDCSPCDVGCATFCSQKPQTGPVAAASFPATHNRHHRYFLVWRDPRLAVPQHVTFLQDMHSHHPTLELLMEEALATRRPHACARAYMLRGLLIARNGGFVCAPCD